MPVMTDTRTVAANTTVENILAGKLHEFISGMNAARIRVFISAAAAGITASCLTGGESFAQDQAVSNSNRFPQDPEDFYAEMAGMMGDRITVGLRNSTGAGIVVNTRVTVDAIG